MLSLTRVNANQASSYYTADDYYLQNSGEWYGQLSTALDYTGTIQEKDFQSLIHGGSIIRIIRALRFKAVVEIISTLQAWI